jgi:hypothetical protein
MLLEKIKQDLIIATKKQDPLILKTLRFILSEINYKKIELQKELNDEDIVTLLHKEVKKRLDAMEMMKKGKREDLVKEEEYKLKVINNYLPKQMTDEEIAVIVKEVLANSPNPIMGPVIGEVVKRTKGKADGKKIAEIVKKLINDK